MYKKWIIPIILFVVVVIVVIIIMVTKHKSSGKNNNTNIESCNGNGKIINPSQCECNDGYGPSTGHKNLCKFSIPSICGTGTNIIGIDENGKCVCKPGFTGTKCDDINGSTFPFNGTRKWYIKGHNNLGGPDFEFLSFNSAMQFPVTTAATTGPIQWYIVPAKTKKNLYSIVNVETGNALMNPYNPPDTGSRRELAYGKVPMPTDNDSYLFSFHWKTPKIFALYNQGSDVCFSLWMDPCFRTSNAYSVLGLSSEEWTKACLPHKTTIQNDLFLVPVK